MKSSSSSTPLATANGEPWNASTGKVGIADSDWIREIEGHPGYYVTSFGQVWSLKQRVHAPGLQGTRTIIGNTLYKLKPRYDGCGYLHVGLDGKTRKVHLLVLKAFSGHRTLGMVSRHLDGNKENNDINNLGWGTQKENCADRMLHGRQYRGGSRPWKNV